MAVPEPSSPTTMRERAKRIAAGIVAIGGDTTHQRVRELNQRNPTLAAMVRAEIEGRREKLAKG